MELIFVRHGESQANILHEFSNRSLKHPLTDKGRRQSVALYRSLQHRKIIKIYSSPVLRAQQTSMILSERFDVEVEITPALREFDVGIYEGRSDDGAWAEYRKVVHAWIHDGAYDVRLPEGESLMDQTSRLHPFIQRIGDEHSAVEGDVVLVTHGGLIRTALPLLVSNLTYGYTEGIPIDNTSYVRIARVADRLICREWCGHPVDARVSEDGGITT